MSIVFAILLFSFLILIHELGHFTAAKLSGVQVNEFSIFMGPAIFKKKFGETQYSLRCIPIGGYCAMEGEDADTDSPRSFQKAAWWKRLIILIAGAAVNFVAGVLIFAIVFIPAQRFVMPVIESAEPECTIVSPEGLHVGDRFVKVNGRRVLEQSDVTLFLRLHSGDVHDIVVERDGERVVLNNFKMEMHPFLNEDGTTTQRYGFRFATEEANFANKLKAVWASTVNSVRSVVLSMEMLLTGKAGFSDLMGPVGIVQVMSDSAAAAPSTSGAFLNMLYFGGFIAINLALMNMLPLPALDGGRSVCLLITTAVEAVTRKKVNPKYEGYIHGAGMVLLLALTAVIMFKDIFVIFKR